MSDEGRTRRQQLETLQARLKQAQLELKQAHSEEYEEELAQLSDEARAAEAEAARFELELKDATGRLDRLRREVEEAERQLLAPRTVSSVSPAAALLVLVGVVLGIVELAAMLAEGPSLAGTLVLAGMLVVPPAALAWIWRRRLGGGR